HTLPRDVSSGLDSVGRWFKAFPGLVVHDMAGFYRMLYTVGKGAVKGLWDGAKSVGSGVVGWFHGLGKDILGALGNLFHFGSPSKVMFKYGKWIVEGLHKGVQSKLSMFQGGLGKVTSGVKQWIGTIQEALKLNGQPLSLTSRVMYQMQTESGGNPRAINLTDINAQNGDPSRGLMQVIGSTFAAYAGRFAGLGIYNPLANIFAAINYAKHRYGPTLMSGGMGIGSGHGYDSGGIAKGIGFMPKYTIKPERVLSPQQTSAFERLVDVLDGKAGGAREIRITGGKLDFDPSRGELWIRDISAQEAREEIAFNAR